MTTSRIVDSPSAETNAEMTSSTIPSPIQKNPSDLEDAVEDQEKEVEYITGLKLYLVLLSTTLVAFLVMLDQTVLVPAIPKITVQFNSLKDIGWYGSAYLLTTSAAQPLTGKIYQHYSTKVVFLICIGIFELGSLICGVAQSSKTLIVGRAISGLGGAGLMLGIITLIAAAAPIQKRPVYLGISMGVSSIGLVVGPILGGVLAEYATWRWCFFINLPFGAITAVLLFLISIPNSQVQTTTKAPIKEQIQRLDPLGFASFTCAIVMLLLAVQWGGTTYAWNSSIVIGLFCGAAGALLVFCLIERKVGDEAMLPLAILRRTKVICIGIMAMLSSGGGLLIAYYLPIWFQVVQGTTPTIGGVHFLPMIGAMVFGTVGAGALVSRLGYFTPFAILGCVLASIGAGLLTTLTPGCSAAKWAGFQILPGIGRGLVLQQGITAIQAALPPAMLPVGSAFVTFINLLGSTLFISFGQTLFTNQLKSGLAHYSPAVDAEKVLAVGATAFRTVVSPSEVRGVLLAYNQALTRIYYLSVGAGCVSLVASFFIGWTNIKTLKAKEATSSEAATQSTPDKV